MKNGQEILERFQNVRVLIVGDVMLDRYWWGTVSRISPEAPVPVVKLERETTTAGGAANVAANVASLGATALLVGSVGDDAAGRELLPQILNKSGVSSDLLARFAARPTTTKTRVVAHQQQVVRIDDENPAPLSDEQARILRAKIIEVLPAADVVILSDYAKGCLCDSVLASVIEAARQIGKPVLVDPKGKSYQKYNGATLLTPNKSEAAAASGVDIAAAHSVVEAGEKLLADLQIDSLLITLGEDGMQLFERGRKPAHFPAAARKVYDVTGAGDTVIATLATALGAGASLAEAAQIANAAAGLAVEQVGTTAVNRVNLSEALMKGE